MCRPAGAVHSVLGVEQDVHVHGHDVCCQGMRRVRVKKLVHFVKSLRRGASTKTLDEKPWWKMLALHSGMERLRLEAGAGRPERQSAHAHARRAVDCAVDRAVRLAAVSADLQLDLPPSIALPDGEEHPYGASTRLHIRDAEQESEIYQKCIRPPPNRTVFDGESPPPYRSSSASASSSGGGGTVLRYPHHSYAAHPHPHPATATAPAGLGVPAVIVPSPPRKQDPSTPALFLAGPGTTGKHSTGPAPAAPSPAPPPGSTAAGLVRLLSPSPTPTPERLVTVKPSACRTAQSAPSTGASRSRGSVDLVNVTSTACSRAVRDIPGAARCGGGSGSHLAALTMVPCLNESRTEMTTTTTTTTSATSTISTSTTTAIEPGPGPVPSYGEGQCSPGPGRSRPEAASASSEPLARPLPRSPV